MKTTLAALAVLSLAVPALAQPATDPARPTTLNLSAYGEVKAAPDMARITLGVTTLATTAAEAMNQNAAQMNAVVAALRRQGIADKDVQTSGLSLGAQYVYPQDQPPKRTGYQAANQVTVIVQDPAKLGAAIDAVTAAGVNQINNISFDLKDPQSAEDEARREAVKALQAKAALYAQATGYRIARLANLSEGTGQVESPRFDQVVVTAARRAPAPIAAGEVSVRIDITGVYELAK